MTRPDRFSPGAAIAGLLSVAIGILFILEAAGSLTVAHGILWPASIVGLGAAMVAEALMRHVDSR